jgi:Ser/Thr protein kinase RdoA (MazF antagonist)
MTTATQPSFPVTYSILSAEALSAEVRRAYGLEGPIRCQLLRPGLNDTYLVSAGNERRILRVYRAGWRSAAEISYELQLLEHLASKAVSVSVPIPARDGDVLRPLPAPEGNRHLVLFSYATGAPLSWEREADSRILGRLAAQVHAAASDFAPSHERFRLDFEYLIEGPLAAIGPFLHHRAADHQYLHRFADTLKSRGVRVAEAGLDWGVCHGDLSAKHVHMSPGGEPTLIDFDLCGEGWRAYDLAAAPYYATYKHAPPSWEAFLAGYREVRSLGRADLEAVPLFHAINRLWSLGLYARNAPRWGSLAFKDGYLDSSFAFMRDWELEHASDL